MNVHDTFMASGSGDARMDVREFVEALGPLACTGPLAPPMPIYLSAAHDEAAAITRAFHDRMAARGVPNARWPAGSAVAVAAAVANNAALGLMAIKSGDAQSAARFAAATSVLWAQLRILTRDETGRSEAPAPHQPFSKARAVAVFKELVSISPRSPGKSGAAAYLREHGAALSGRQFAAVWAEHAPPEWRRAGRKSHRPLSRERPHAA